MNLPTPQVVVVWYQAPQHIVTSPEKLPYYEGVMRKIQDRASVFPQLQLDFIFCPVTDMVNLAGETMIFAGLEQDLWNAGFRPVEIPNNGMDQQERQEFRDMILQGGKLH